MCISPCKLYIDEHPFFQMVACRYCWQCRANRVNDLVGRCIAEQNTSEQTLAVTLTYGGGEDNPHAQALVYSDIQKFLKRLRKTKRGEPKRKVRYLVTGEYGSNNGRAHWHIILFISGNLLPVSPTKIDRKPHEIYIAVEKWDRIEWSGWPHGLSYFQAPDYGAFAYALKYVLKDLNLEVHRTHLAMSKKPPLGHDFFMQLADAHVKQSLAPRSLDYAFADVFDRKGKRKGFYLQGRMAEIYLDAYRALWSISRGSLPPYSELLLEREDKLIDLDLDWTDERWAEHIAQKRPPRSTPDAEYDEFQQHLDGLYETRHILDIENKYILVEHIDGTAAVYIEDHDPWHATNVDEALQNLQRLGYRMSHVERHVLDCQPDAPTPKNTSGQKKPLSFKEQKPPQRKPRAIRRLGH
ncbi:rolling circle replication-associated protein [Roseobacter sp. MH60115]|uniref:rolling circle replication-associated protein n=1 Tax=Roseobacter sp. MH60115 TaxID=2785324 RepID=UPI0018A30DB8|nr:hypothetical protein [Roseobacter sp. MH60115]